MPFWTTQQSDQAHQLPGWSTQPITNCFYRCHFWIELEEGSPYWYERITSIYHAKSITTFRCSHNARRFNARWCQAIPRLANREWIIRITSVKTNAWIQISTNWLVQVMSTYLVKILWVSKMWKTGGGLKEWYFERSKLTIQIKLRRVITFV